ncbi:MAG: BREX system ATP-binding domain-containing protein [Candidatus Aenigmatarchaeota archaeon]
MMSQPDLDIKELILLHLKMYEKKKSSENERSDKVPLHLSESSIADSINKNPTEVSEALQELQTERLIEPSVEKIRGKDRKRRVYSLSDQGSEKVSKLWKEIKRESIKVETGSGQKEIRLEELDTYIGKKDAFASALSKLDQEGVLDLSDMNEKDKETFVGRKEELEELADELDDVKRKGSRVLFIEGEAGVGKTTLINEFKPFALKEDFDFLHGGCYSDISEPFLPFKEAFEDYMENESEEDVSPLSFIGAPKGPEIEDKKMFDAQRQATFHKTTQEIKKIVSQNPLVIFLDDMHWTDQATLQILGYIVDNLQEESILFICTYRPEDVEEGHPLKEMIHRLKRRDLSEKLTLSPLGERATRDIIVDETGVSKKHIPERFVKTIHHKTDGNPLFVKEYMNEMIERGAIEPEGRAFPVSVEDMDVPDVVLSVIERRVDRLDDKTKKVLELGSIIGEEIPFSLLLKTSSMDEFDLLDHIDVLTENRLWHESIEGGRFYFHHDLIRDAVYHALMDRKRRVYHKKVAENIREVYSEDIEQKYLPLARHYERAKEFKQALDHYLKAGKKAEGVYAHEDAIECYKQALSVGEQLSEEDVKEEGREKIIETLEELGNAFQIIGKGGKAVETYRRALRKVERSQKEADLHRKIAEVREKEAEYDKGLERCEKGMKAAERDAEEVVELLNTKGWIFFRKGSYDEAEKFLNEGMEIAEEVGNEKLIAETLHKLGSVHFGKGDYERALEHLKEALSIRKSIGDEAGMAKSINNIGTVYWNKGDLDKALQLFKQSLELERKIGNKQGIAQSLNNIGTIYWNKGELDRALENYEKSREISKEIGDEAGIANTLHNMGLIHYNKGDLEKALQDYKRSVEIKENIGDKEGLTGSLTGIGDVYAEKEEFEKAEENYWKSIEICSEIGNKVELVSNHTGLGEVKIEKENMEDALRHAKQAVELSTELGMKNKEGMSRRVLGTVYREKGDLEKAVEEFKEAMKTLHGIGSQVEKAKATYEYAHTFKEKDEDSLAEGYFSNALESFEKMGMGLWKERCEEALAELDTNGFQKNKKE